MFEPNNFSTIASGVHKYVTSDPRDPVLGQDYFADVIDQVGDKDILFLFAAQGSDPEYYGYGVIMKDTNGVKVLDVSGTWRFFS